MKIRFAKSSYKITRNFKTEYVESVISGAICSIFIVVSYGEIKKKISEKLETCTFSQITDISRKISIEHPSVGARFARPINIYIYTDKHNYTRKMVPITGRAGSFLIFFEFSSEVGGQNNNNRPIKLLMVISFSTDYKYTT